MDINYRMSLRLEKSAPSQLKSMENDNTIQEDTEPIVKNEFIKKEKNDTVKNSKFSEWFEAMYVSSFQTSNTIDSDNTDTEDDSLLNDPLFIHGYLEQYRDTLYYYNCPNELEQTIMSELEQEFKSYYYEHKEDGLTEYLNQIFAELCDQYMLNSPSFNVFNDLEQYLNETKFNLINEYEYNDDYAEIIKQFIEQKLNITPNNKELNFEELKTEIDNITAGLTDKTELQGLYCNYRISVDQKHIDCILSDDYSSKSLQNEFFAFMFNNTLESYNEHDYYTIIKRIFYDTANAIGASTETSLDGFTFHEDKIFINIADFVNLNNNCDESWLDNFYSIISNIINDVEKNAEYENAQFIEPNELFGEKDTLSPEDITQALDSMLFSDDEGVVKLRSMLNQAFDRFNVDNYYDETELLTDIIKMLNNEAGASNEKPIRLTKETFAILNDGDIFEKLEDIINGEELRNRYYFDIDDELDVYAEARESGACWAIADLTSLSQTPIGAQMIKDAMTINYDGEGNLVSVTVTFAGVKDDDGNPKSYTVTKEEIEYAKDHSDGLSYGDNTMLVLLLATEKLREELGNSGNVHSSNLSPEDPGYWVFGGESASIITWLTGKSSFSVGSCYKDLVNSIIDNLDEQYVAYMQYCINTKNYGTNNYAPTVVGWIEKILAEKYGICDDDTTYFSAYEMLKPGILSGDVVLTLSTSMPCTVTLSTPPDGEKITISVGGHEWAVKNVTEDTITFWDLYRQEEYTVYTIDVLNNFSFHYTVINDNYELPDIIGAQNFDPADFDLGLDFDTSNIIRDKSTFDDVIVEGTSMTIEEILNYDDNELISIFDEKAKRRIDGLFYSLRDSNQNDDYKEMILHNIMISIDKCIKQIYSHMPNYTDYVAINNAYSETEQYYATMLEQMLPFDDETIFLMSSGHLIEEVIASKYGARFDMKAIFEKFLSFLPDDNAT